MRLDGEPAETGGPLEAWGRKRPRVADGLLVVVAVAARVAVWAAGARNLDLPFRNLSLLFDGHLYLLVARTLPTPYAGALELFPLLPSAEFISGWFPAYPIVIGGIHWILGDLRLAALLGSAASGVAATLVVRRLATTIGPRPLLTALIFAVCPAGWLLSSSLALVDSLLVALAAGTILAVWRGRFGWALGLASAAVLTQKSGVLVPLLGALAAIQRSEPRSLLRGARVLIAWSALGVMQLWLWWLFGNPMANFDALRPLFGLSDGFFGLTWPGGAWLRHFLDPSPLFVERRWATAATLALYLTALAAVTSLRQPRVRWILGCWILVPLLFYSVLNSPWPYFSLWRFMTLATPAAICALCAVAPSRTVRPWAALAIVALLLVGSIRGTTREIRSAALFMDGAYSRSYFETFVEQVIGPADR